MATTYKYAIVNTVDIDDIAFSDLTSQRANVRYKIDESQFLVKFTSESTPPTLNDYTIYTQSSILTLLQNIDNGWQENLNPED